MMKRALLFLTLLGIVLPYGAFLPWLLEHGPDLPLFYNQAIANPVSIFAWLDVLNLAVALLLWIVVDGQQHQIRHRWLAMIGTLTIGVSCGLPFYLYLRVSQRQ
ncbi:DUF2834 domain-containing protein [Photobacterium sp. CCB-ST2H9]|uniref:DUF2834 domain-containing protein n=1 Tax=Photobacterium sp. CCB-ST2H9 TaxID=2912855 RepID=UPI0035326131